VWSWTYGAAVAGAIAEFVGKELLNYSSEVIIKNGGDIFIKSNRARRVSIFAGNSPPELENHFKSRCTRELYRDLHIFWNSGSFFKFWEGGCVTVISDSVLLADAAATAVGNIVKTRKDIEQGLIYAQKIKGVRGVVIIKDDKIGPLGRYQFYRGKIGDRINYYRFKDILSKGGIQILCLKIKKLL
jgi:ApbE superfamily uncharacterized protein (UPF0280 family)